MKVIGTISEYSTSKGGFGKIKCTENPEVRFERFECNYNTIRVNDKVGFDLVKSFDGIYDALNVEFISNTEISELDSYYQKQSPFIGCIRYKTFNGFVIAFKNITLFLPERYCFNEQQTIGESREFYVHTFSYHNSLIASTKAYRPEGFLETFAPYINSKESFLFEVIEIEEYGISMCRDGYIGFVPNSHILPFEKEKVNICDELHVKVISCSASSGLVLSIRNYYASDSIIKLRQAFDSEEILIGSITEISSRFLAVKCLDVKLKMNIQHVVADTKQVGEEIAFKIVEFSATKDISVSNIETTEFSILNQLRSTNLFTATVVSIRENGVFLAINKLYNSAFMPLDELTEILDKTDALNRLRIGSTIHCSILQFDCFGIYVSRLKYKKKKRQAKASFSWNVNDRVRVKIKDKMAMFGFLVENDSLKGLISIGDMLPDEIRVEIDLLAFVKHTKSIFRRRSVIGSIISKVDKENNRFLFDFDLSDSEVEQKIEEMIEFFSYDKNLHLKIKSYYTAKKDQQQISRLEMKKSSSDLILGSSNKAVKF